MIFIIFYDKFYDKLYVKLYVKLSQLYDIVIFFTRGKNSFEICKEFWF